MHCLLVYAEMRINAPRIYCFCYCSLIFIVLHLGYFCYNVAFINKIRGRLG